jgi:ubiquinol-cytochrome c reductase cytochrome b subunit
MLGMAEGTPAETIESRVWTVVYFAFFALMPIVTSMENTKPVPERVTT